MKFWIALPWVLLFVGVLRSFYPAQSISLNDVETDILIATAVIIFEIRRRAD